MRALVPFLFLVPLFAAAIWVNIWARRQRRYYREHPQERPFGWKLLARVAPFAAIGVAAAIYGLVVGDLSWLVLGAICVGCFAWEVRRRWHPPA